MSEVAVGGKHKFSIRPLASFAECEAAVKLQHKIWGDDVRETVPISVLQICQEVGGVAAGAFDDKENLVGFVFGLTGPKDGMLVHWSHILATEESWRDRGVGRQLKHYQREKIESLGVSTMFWTFDPLECRNAFLNLRKLGAKVVRYVPNHYGEEAIAITDTVIGSDRFVVRWEFTKQNQTPRSSTAEVETIPLVSTTTDSNESNFDPTLALESAVAVRIEIPSAIQELKETAPEEAILWREATRRAFMHYLNNGYCVTEFSSLPSGNGCYILKRNDNSA